MQNICTLQIYPAVKEEEITKFEGKYVELGKCTSEVTQSLKDKYHMFFFMCLSQLLISVFMYVCGFQCRYRL